MYGAGVGVTTTHPRAETDSLKWLEITVSQRVVVQGRTPDCREMVKEITPAALFPEGLQAKNVGCGAHYEPQSNFT